jgi:hypothetical protein
MGAGLEDPGDVGVGECSTKGVGHGENKNGIPQRREHDQEDGAGSLLEEAIQVPVGGVDADHGAISGRSYLTTA